MGVQSDSLAFGIPEQYSLGLYKSYSAHSAKVHNLKYRLDAVYTKGCVKSISSRQCEIEHLAFFATFE